MPISATEYDVDECCVNNVQIDNLNLELKQNNLNFSNSINNDIVEENEDVKLLNSNIEKADFEQNTTQKQNPNINIITNTTPGGSVTITIMANVNATGNITLNTAGKTITTKLVNGGAVETIDLTPGTYSIDLLYSGDENFEKITHYYFQKYSIMDINTTLITPTSNIVMFYKNGTKFKVTLVDSKGKPLGSPDVISLNKYVYITVNNRTYEKRLDINGSTFLNLNLKPGKYVISTVFKGTNVYPSSNLTTNLTILSDLVCDDLVMYYRNGSQFLVKVVDGKGVPLVGESVRLNINGVFYTRVTGVDGVARLNISLIPGKYVITAIHPVTGLQVGHVVNVLSDLVCDDLVMYYRDGSQFLVKVVDGKGVPLVGESVRLNINGVFYTRVTGVDGVARLNISLIPGKYVITAIHPVTGLQISKIITVLPKDEQESMYVNVSGVAKFDKSLKNNISVVNTNLITTGIDVHTNIIHQTGSLGVYLKDNNGIKLNIPDLPIQITINGITYLKYTDSYGIARLNINLLARDDPYSVGLYFAGNSVYSSVGGTFNMYVFQKDTLLTIISNTVHKGNSLKIKLTDSTHIPIANKIVKITINGVTYEKVSNQQGIAQLNIKLNPNTYVASVAFESQSGYKSASTITKNILVCENNNLKSTLLTPLNNVVNPEDYFKVKLADGVTGNPLSGKTISITINGVNYYRTTDNNGIAQISLRLLSKTYEITSNFNGDSYYSSTSCYKLVQISNSLTDKNYTGTIPLSVYKSASNYYCNYSDSYIQNLANTITQTCSDDLEKSIAIHNYVYPMIYVYYGGANHTALDSLTLFRGNCVDKTSSFVALSRASNLPVRYVVGDGININDDGHAWAQICINDVWIVSDPTNTILLGDWNSNQGYYKNYRYAVLVS